MGDGFTASQQGDWQRPRLHPHSFFTQAIEAMQAMMQTRPFSYFAHLFKVYAIPIVSRVGGIEQLNVTPSPSQSLETAINIALGDVDIGVSAPSYFGTRFINTGSTIRMPDVGQREVRRYSRINGRYPHMIQVIANENRHGGVGLWHGRNLESYVPINPSLDPPSGRVRISLTATNRAPGGLWIPRWHGSFIHEFGHTFGELVDNHSNLSAGCMNNLRANITSNTTNLKWRHWLGHRYVANAPVYAITGGSVRRRWYVPSEFVMNGTTIISGNCIMAGSSVHRSFNGVASAELIRRMARISGETFLDHIERPNWGVIQGAVASSPPIAVPPEYITIRENEKNRILDSAFHGNTGLLNVTIPASIRYIGEFAFLGTESLRTINNLAVIPQRINNTTFAASGSINGVPNQLDRSRITVNIPLGTYHAYRAAGWTGFNLVDAAFSFMPISSGGLFARPIAANVALSNAGMGLGGIIEVPSVALVGDANIWVFRSFNLVRVPVTTITRFGGFMGEGIIIPQSIRYMSRNAFANTNPNLKIFSKAAGPSSTWEYGWNAGRAVYFYSAMQPTEAGQFWRFDENRIPTPWAGLTRYDPLFDTNGTLNPLALTRLQTAIAQTNRTAQ
ncbi:MAG: leucine-rich repeat protein, partial [Firmicutes bacterium]|nr:leucine-rich repeat protein [Bacillota bacterium]